jgi:tetratricopeptide (TPR) repeat protein
MLAKQESQAFEYSKQAQVNIERLATENPTLRIDSLSIEADIETRRGNLPLALQRAQQAHQLAQLASGKSSIQTLTINDQLAGILLRIGGAENMTRAKQFLDSTLKLQRNAGLSETRAGLTTLSNLGFWFAKSGQLEKAVSTYEEVARKRTLNFGADDVETYKAQSQLGNALDQLSIDKTKNSKTRLEASNRALELLTDVREKQTDLLGDGHPSVCLTSIYLNTVWRRHASRFGREQVEEHLETTERTITKAIEERGTTDRAAMRLRNQLGLSFVKLKRYDDAFEQYQLAVDGLQQRRKKLGISTVDDSEKQIIGNLAAQLQRKQQWQQSVDLMSPLEPQLDPPSKTCNFDIARQLAIGFYKLGRMKKAASLLSVICNEKAHGKTIRIEYLEYYCQALEASHRVLRKCN